jgi:hypothetical protein
VADETAPDAATTEAPATTEAAPAAPVDERAAFLASVAAARTGATAPVEEADATETTAEAEPEVAAAADPDADLEDDTDDPATPEDPDADLDDEDEDAALAKAAKADPDLAKRLGVLQRQEQRQRAAFERERQTFARERAEWQEQTKAIAASAKRFESIAARFEHDPMGVLEEMKVSPSAFEAIARTVFANTETGKADPKNAAIAASMRAKLAERGELAELKAKQEKLEQEIANRDAAAKQEAVLNRYFEGVTKVVGEKTPLTAKLIASNPARARHELEIVAFDLAQQNGKLPTEKAVVIAYEKKRRAELRDLGIDPKAALAAKAPAAAAPAARTAKTAVRAAPPAPKPAPAAAAAARTPPPPAPAAPSRSRDPGRDEFLAEMARIRSGGAQGAN